MSQLSHKIIELYNLSGKIDFYFETLIVDLNFNKNKKISFRKSLIMNFPDKLFDMPKENNLQVGFCEN